MDINYLKVCIDHYNLIISAMLNLREFHFTTTNQAEHNLTNDIMPELSEYGDSIMENIMGICGRPERGLTDINIKNFNSIKECLEDLRLMTLEFKKLLTHDAMSGIVNILDDLITDLNKWIYLSENK